MSPERYIFRRKRRWYSSPLQIFFLSLFIISGLFVIQGFRRKEIKPLFLPTPTPTRVANSFAQEAETHFNAGNLDAAIEAYKKAIAVDPKNGTLYAELARILTYSTEAQTTDKERKDRFQQALDYTKQATELSPDDSTAFAVRAFTLDWYAAFLTGIERNETEGSKVLNEAEQAIARAVSLDETNILAQVYRAEIMIDLSRWDLAASALQTALKADPNLWEAHRVNALFLENQGKYIDSINELDKAVSLVPNLTFLYIKLGQAWRSQALMNWRNEEKAKQYYDKAIEYFNKAVQINKQLGIKDPKPYLGIGRAYAQEGEFYIASLNMNTAIQIDPYNADVYGQLGMVYRQARNYEDAIMALGCVVKGCTPDITCTLRKCNSETDPPITIEKQELSDYTIVYYYTYASLKAAMYQPGNPDRKDYCDDAMGVIRDIKGSAYGKDQTIMSILTEGENICQNLLSQPLQQETPAAKTTPDTRPTPTLFPRATATPSKK